MKKYIGNEDPVSHELETIEKRKLETPEAEPPMPTVPPYDPPVGLMNQFRRKWQEAGKPKYRNPVVAAVLQVVPGLGYVYMWRMAFAALTAFLFLLAYVILGLRILQYKPEVNARLATPVNPNPEPDLWNWSLLTPESITLLWVALALLAINLGFRTYHQARLNNLNLQVKSLAEIRKARGTFIQRVLTFNYLALIIFVFGILQVAKDSDFDLGRLISKLDNIKRYVGELLNPNWNALFTEKGIMFRARETVEISIIGTLAGAVVALLISFLAARNLMGRNPITNVAYYIVRIILSIQRSIPTLFLAIVFVVSVGVGPFPAVLALTIFSAGLMTKLFSEAIEAIDWGQVEAISAAGGGPVHVVLFAVIPQVLPYYISHILYSWEVNIHSASVLGLVGAGGIGQYVQDAINTYKYADIGMALFIVIVITMAIDFTSAYIRAKIL
ncbi:MAG: Phosphonate transporter, permease protein PhnE [Chloroflexi bacterium]|jgi:phosphonate transport system permease protein|nr:Phosphonate transporter, permease protein PhnE [Chloroflexota bacterium]